MLSSKMSGRNKSSTIAASDAPACFRTFVRASCAIRSKAVPQPAGRTHERLPRDSNTTGKPDWTWKREVNK